MCLNVTHDYYDSAGVVSVGHLVGILSSLFDLHNYGDHKIGKKNNCSKQLGRQTICDLKVVSCVLYSVEDRIKVIPNNKWHEKLTL